MEKILVTGAGGFLGRNLVEELLQPAFEVWGTVHRQAGWSFPGLNTIHLDLTDPIAVASAIETIQPNTVFHCAASGVAPGTDKDLELNMSVNLDATVSLFKACEKNSVKTFIHVGSCFEYGNSSSNQISEMDLAEPTTAYGFSKLCATQYLKMRSMESKTQVSILRCFGMWGPYEKLPRLVPSIIQASRLKTRIPMTPGEQIRDYSYVKDVASWISDLWLQQKLSNGHILNLGSGEPVSIKQLAMTVADSLGCQNLIEFGALSYRDKEMMRLVADVSNLNTLLPFRKKTMLAEGIQQTMKVVI